MKNWETEIANWPKKGPFRGVKPAPLLQLASFTSFTSLLSFTSFTLLSVRYLSKSVFQFADLRQTKRESYEREKYFTILQGYYLPYPCKKPGSVPTTSATMALQALQLIRSLDCIAGTIHNTQHKPAK